jgi:hypothetical protein
VELEPLTHFAGVCKILSQKQRVLEPLNMCRSPSQFEALRWRCYSDMVPNMFFETLTHVQDEMNDDFKF